MINQLRSKLNELIIHKFKNIEINNIPVFLRFIKNIKNPDINKFIRDVILYYSDKITNKNSIDESLYWLVNDIIEVPKCSYHECKNETKFIDFRRGYRKYCSKKCSAFDNRENNKITCMERYGVRHVMQNPKIFEKCQKAQQQAAYKYKDYVSPSGKSYKVQGYEGPVINYLLQAGVQENDLTNIRFEVPIVPYSFDKKERIYFPDIYIKSKRMLVEVKSTYTYKSDLEKNLAKQKAAKKLGYHHIIVVLDAANDSIVQII